MEKEIRIGSDGVYLKSTSELLRGYEKADFLEQVVQRASYPVADDVKQGLVWDVAKIPTDVIAPVLGTIQKYPSMETGYLMYYNPVEEKWLMLCPHQPKGSCCALTMNKIDESLVPEGYHEMGSIHTHPSGIPAMWSSVDYAGQRQLRSMHIVFSTEPGTGIVRDTLCTVFTLAINPKSKERFSHEYNQRLEDVFEHPEDLSKPYAPVDEWVKQIEEDKRVPDKSEVSVKPAVLGTAFDHSYRDVYYPHGAGIWRYDLYTEDLYKHTRDSCIVDGSTSRSVEDALSRTIGGLLASDLMSVEDIVTMITEILLQYTEESVNKDSLDVFYKVIIDLIYNVPQATEEEINAVKEALASVTGEQK